MVYDAGNRRLLAFGGELRLEPLADTLEWGGGPGVAVR